MNKNLYLILVSIEVDREELIKKLEENNIIDTWFFAFPNSIFVRSELNAMKVGQFVDEHTNKKLNFITIVTDDYFGRLSTELWKKFDPIKYNKASSNI